MSTLKRIDKSTVRKLKGYTQELLDVDTSKKKINENQVMAEKWLELVQNEAK